MTADGSGQRQDTAPGGGPRLAVIGPGRAGTAVALVAAAAGYRVDTVAGGGRASLDRFRALLPHARATTPERAVGGVDVVLLAVPDAEVVGVQRALAVADVVEPGSRWVHLAGSMGAEALEQVRLAGARVAACHPAQTLPDPERGAAALADCGWAVTAAPADRQWAHALVADLGGTGVDVAESDRVLYHAAMSLAANATGAIVALARDLLTAVRMPQPERFLEPLATAAVTGAAQHGVRALTGPVRRGDAGTVAAHLSELSTALPEAREAYRVVAALALGQSRRAGLDERSVAAIAEVLHPRDVPQSRGATPGDARRPPAAAGDGRQPADDGG